MKNLSLYFVLALFGGSLMFSSCGDNKTDPKPNPGPDTTSTNVVKSGDITANETWSSDSIYELKGKVVVNSGATLTIQPGTIIKGQEGAETNASALVVARGGKLMAEGTADNPIIFTTINDNIKVGEKMGTNLSRTDNEQWGGVVILGNAPISAEKGDTEANIEGIPAGAGYGLYGGTVADDNSGVIKYVSIRHGGISIGDGNELNGMTLGGVGSGTTIDHVEIFATLDDGIEFFGGTVNVTNALVYWQGDDGLDVDQNYSGTISNFAVYHGEGVGTDEGLEIDGPEGQTYVDGLFTMTNGTLVSDGIEGSSADLKSKAQGTIENVYFKGYTNDNFIKLRTSFEDFCGAVKSDAYTYYTNATPTLVIKNSEFGNTAATDTLLNVYTASVQSAAEGAPLCVVPAEQQTAAESVFTNPANGIKKEIATPTVGADMSMFTGWTIASMKELL